MGRRTTIRRAAHLYSRCLQIAAQNALMTVKGSKLTEDDVRAALNSDSIRQYLLVRKHTLDVRKNSIDLPHRN